MSGRIAFVSFLLVLCLPYVALAQSDLVITGVIDGPLSGGLPKAVEFYSPNGIIDLSQYAFRSANNGNGTGPPEFTFPAISLDAQTCLWVATEASGFASFFGFPPTFTNGSAPSVNGDDAIELFKNGSVIDVFGEVDTDGTGEPWEYTDGWAYRTQATGPDGSTFVLGNWLFSGPNALAGETTNAGATTPFPTGTYPSSGACALPIPQPELLLTEMVVTPTAGEFIEIYNPGSAAINLSDVYLTDATFAGGGTYYYNIVTGTNAGGGGFGDFHARFPDGATIAPGEYQTVALPGSDDFFATYGFDPDYELYEDGGPDAVPDMREALPGSINNQGGLTNSGEVVILYAWDGASDLVVDLDYGLWGDKAEAVDKTGVVIDGPDGDATGSAYLPDTAIVTQDVVSAGSHSGGDAFNRVDLTEGTETQGGGNGINGSDETSENLSVTWASDRAVSPGLPAPPAPPSGDWVVNEILADPASGLAGDANNDGVRDFSDDEFVEIVNVSGAAVDISGWTLSDAVTVRHVFAAGTVVEDQCGVVVFGGGAPTGFFGGCIVQTASSGALSLNNSGDTVTLNDGSSDVAIASYGSEGGNNQSLTLDPDLTGSPWTRHSSATGAGGALFSPGTLIDGSQFVGCPFMEVDAEIHDIQGSGLTSPLEGRTVITDDNVVTTLGLDGFFMQTPDSRVDADPDTSQGIFVFTGGAPGVAVGDNVDVTGVVAEFFGMTEIGSPVVVDDGQGTLPTVVDFNETTPSPSPGAPSCSTGFADPSLQFECFEGMSVRIVGGRVTQSNQAFGGGTPDPVAEVFITSASQRTFREEGIESPGIAGLPEWDGNPEVFELDPDRLGLPNGLIPAGSSFDALGVIGFEFGDYELWPSSLTVTAAPLPVAVRNRQPGEFTVGSLNLFRLFDDVDDPADGDRDDEVIPTSEYELRLEKLVLYVLDVIGAPDILGVQEAESLNVLQDLADAITAVDPSVVYTPYLEEGNDIGSIDVGFLARRTIQVDSVDQLGADELLTFDGSLLHDRPPLLLQGSCLAPYGEFPINVMVVHNRSLSGIDSSSRGERVRQKRYEQAQSIAEKVQAIQTAEPIVGLVVIGDFNAFEFTDGYVDVTGQIAGEFDPGDNLICDSNSCDDLVNPDLAKLVLGLDPQERYSFTFVGNAQALDQALVSTALGEYLASFELGRGNADAARIQIEEPGTPLRASDHDGLVLFVQKDSDNDGVPDPIDVCLGTEIPESVPTQGLGTNRWALVDGDGVFDTVTPNGKPAKNSFTLGDTAGCSCEQIIENAGLGSGHEKFGCSLGAMRNWVELVNP